MDTVNLEGLFINDINIYNNILQKFYDKILKITFYSTINCNIVIDKIYLKNSYNCEINIINKCITNQSSSLKLLLQSIIESKDLMSDKLKKKIEKNLGINLNINAEQQNNKGFLKRCNLSSSVTNNITIKELSILNCNGSSNPLKFVFYNTGDANTNCGINELVNAIGKKDSEQPEPVYDYCLNKVLNLNKKDIIIITILIFIILFLIIFYKTIFNKNIKIMHIEKFNIKYKK